MKLGFVGREGKEVASARNIKARKKLKELYARGVEVRFNGDGGRRGPFDEPASEDEVAMFISPPNPLQREMALREAQAARARSILATKRNEDSEEFLTAMAFLSDMSDETLAEYVAAINQDSRRSESMREVLGREEWKDFTALQDAMRQFDESGASEDDDEWKDLIERDREYGRQVIAEEGRLLEADRESLKLLPREELERRARDKRGELASSQRFVEEYERQMSFYSVRDPQDHRELFFENADEWSEQNDVIQSFVTEVIGSLINDGAEAKNSPRAVSGSDLSELPSEQEISDPSIQETANE